VRVDTVSGLLDCAEVCLSPNRDARPADAPIDLLVIHGISLPPGQFGGPWIDALFTNTLDPAAHPYFEPIAGRKVSAHLLVRRDGGIVQYVPFHERAWHAGESCYAGRDCCNDFSIGIELEGVDEYPYEDTQYRVLARVIAALLQAYPGLNTGRIAAHSDIAPGRKTDPGPSFQWPRLYALLNDRLNADNGGDASA